MSFKILIVFLFIIAMCSGCSKNNTSDIDNIDNVIEEVNNETDEDTIINLEKMEKYNYGYDPVETDTAVIAGVFVTNTSEIKIEFLNMSTDEQIVATLSSKDNEVCTETATSENTDLKFANLKSETEYTIELKNTGNEAVGIECLISQ
ncbi:MAG: hypothetical protein PHF63_02185 [Herbinix sp.]|nr:hypothetical protein [Herbinix sp.]